MTLPSSPSKHAIPLWRRHQLLFAATLFSLLAAFYWTLIASDRYVSEARVIIQRSDLTSNPAMDFSSLLAGGSGNRTDQLLMRDYLLSLDMLKKLDAKLGLRQHYSRNGDWLSRLWDPDTPLDQFIEHFRTRVSVELDEYAGVLSIKAQAYSPEMAQAIAAAMVADGEATMNAMAHSLAREQVTFLETQVTRMGERVQATRAALLAYQNRKGLVSPEASAANLAAIVGRLEGQLTELQTRRNALLGYLQPGSANVVELDLQIEAVRKQIATESARLASPAGQTLNATVEEFQRLQLEAQFAQNVLNTALTALERGRVEATRTLKQVSVLQSAGFPEMALEPRRAYNLLVFVVLAFVIAGVLQLLAAVVRDHQD